LRTSIEQILSIALYWVHKLQDVSLINTPNHEEPMKTKKQQPEKNLPTMTKQTAGGIGGAALGGMIAGPVGAVVGGVAGALVGNSSARGNKPIKKAVEAVKSTLHLGKSAKAVEKKVEKKVSSAVGAKSKPTSKTTAKAAAKKSTAKPSPKQPAKAKASSKPAKKK
jgi:hypothetical protein